MPQLKMHSLTCTWLASTDDDDGAAVAGGRAAHALAEGGPHGFAGLVAARGAIAESGGFSSRLDMMPPVAILANDDSDGELAIVARSEPTDGTRKNSS
jgi:hypothetical protein